jgi:hypothetical protein
LSYKPEHKPSLPIWQAGLSFICAMTNGCR